MKVVEPATSVMKGAGYLYEKTRQRLGGKKPEGITRLRIKKRRPRLCSAEAAWLGGLVAVA